jgi:hypothetical protein
MRCVLSLNRFLRNQVFKFCYERKSEPGTVNLLRSILTRCWTHRILRWERHSLTHSRSWALIENLSIVQPLKNFLASYGTRRFITAFTRALHWSLSWARSIQSIPSHPCQVTLTENLNMCRIAPSSRQRARPQVSENHRVCDWQQHGYHSPSSPLAGLSLLWFRFVSRIENETEGDDILKECLTSKGNPKR